MTFAIVDLMECVIVEIVLECMRNIIITCVYRKSGSNIETFKDRLEELMKDSNDNKTLGICGDFNIDS